MDLKAFKSNFNGTCPDMVLALIVRWTQLIIDAVLET